MVNVGREPLFAVYCARCPSCGAWDVWDTASPLFVNGPRVPFKASCLVCENVFCVNSFDTGFVSFETGMFEGRPAADG